MLNYTDDLVTCDDSNTLPTDLFSVNGGSSGYGGPQVCHSFFVCLFRITDQSTLTILEPKYWRHQLAWSLLCSFRRIEIHFPVGINYLNYGVIALRQQKYSVPKPLYVKARTETQGVSFAIMKNSTIQTATSENLWSLTPPGPYTFSLTYTPTGVSCPMVDLSLIARSNQTITGELQCPIELPNPEVPPSSVTINGSKILFSDQYVFTKSRIDQGQRMGYFTYRIQLDIRRNTTIHAALGYEALATNFWVSILSATGSQSLAVGTNSPATNSDSYFNYYNQLSLQLDPGSYILQISDRLRSGFTGGDNYCHQFSLTLETVATSNDPILSAVSTIQLANSNARTLC